MFWWDGCGRRFCWVEGFFVIILEVGIGLVIMVRKLEVIRRNFGRWYGFRKNFDNDCVYFDLEELREKGRKGEKYSFDVVF